MIKINISNNNINEKIYIIDIIFNEFLGLEYRLEQGSNDYEIELENGNKLIIGDHFFNHFPKDLEYLKEKNIPKKVELVKNEFIVEDNIPVIYGNSKFKIQNSKLITCGIDIFSSSFFMLTRWEEYVNKNRDNHDRFPAYESLAFKQDFLDRPIVNEYIEMLWNMLEYLETTQKRKIQNHQRLLTHDVDVPLKYESWRSGLRKIAGDLIKRRNIKSAAQNLLEKVKVCLGLEKDPYDSFDYLMDVSERIGIKAYFFFMGEGVTKYDNYYKSNDYFITKLIKDIKNRGHYIGIHPTYAAYNNNEQFEKEKKELEKNFNIKIIFGREHYLRFEVPVTWQIWEDNGMEWDSTLGFADKEGFRCGVCYEYSVFNILTRQKLKLKEKPLLVMEGNFITYQLDINQNEMIKKIRDIIDKVKKYNGEFILLWHNSHLEKNKNLYENIVVYEKNLKA